MVINASYLMSLGDIVKQQPRYREKLYKPLPEVNLRKIKGRFCKTRQKLRSDKVKYSSFHFPQALFPLLMSYNGQLNNQLPRLNLEPQLLWLCNTTYTIVFSAILFHLIFGTTTLFSGFIFL